MVMVSALPSNSVYFQPGYRQIPCHLSVPIKMLFAGCESREQLKLREADVKPGAPRDPLRCAECARIDNN